MKSLALLCLVTALSPLSAWSSNPDKIIGGKKSAGHDFFLQLSMDGTLDRAFCGSTAIAPGVAVTAAHCVTSKTTSFKLIHGLDQDGKKNLTVIDVEAVISHQSYTGSTFNDIALIFYNQDQAKNVVKPAPINRGQINFNSSTELRAIGRGNKTSIGTIYDELLYEVQIPYIDLNSCMSVSDYQGAVNSTHLCAGVIDGGGSDSCQGDSGGPLVAMINGQATLVGVTNFGLGCGQKGLPGVYASLKAHASWIDTNIARYNSNESVAQPNMDFAFASKCHVIKSFDQNLQQQNTNDLGMIQISTLYMPTTRFMKTSSQLSMNSSSKLCDFELGGKTYEAKVDTVRNKIIVKNSANQWWVASTKRQTDSFYQRCAQNSPAVNFDIAAGDGAVMMNVNGSTGRLIEIEASQIPSDTTKVAGCTIDRFDTAISTSQSAGAILVTLKNHMDDKTKTFVLGGGSSGGSSTNEGTLSATLDVNSSSSATLTLDNSSDQDLFSWEITCNKDFSAFNSNKISNRTIRYHSSEDSKGTVLEGQSVQVTINFATANPNGDGKLSCKVNRSIGVKIN